MLRWIVAGRYFISLLRSLFVIEQGAESNNGWFIRFGHGIWFSGHDQAVHVRGHQSQVTDKIYTDENLLGTWSAFDALPNYTATASQGASQELVAVSQNGSSGGTMGSGSEMKQSIVSTGESHIVALGVTSGHNVKNGGSGGARTRHKSNNDGPFAATPSQIASQKPVSPGHDLSRVVAAWSKLPSPFKAAILAIVNSAEGQP